MEIIKYFFIRLQYWLSIIDLPSIVIAFLPKKDKQEIEKEIARLDNAEQLTNFEKREVVAKTVLLILMDRIKFNWVNFLIAMLSDKEKERLANAIVELLFFSFKNRMEYSE
jgi:predicted flavoprotein YhiN